MTDKQLRQAIGRVLLPEYEAAVPNGEEHIFSQRFELEMDELMGRKDVREKDKALTEKRAAKVRRFHIRLAVTAAALAIAAGVAGAVWLLAGRDSDKEIKPQTSPKIAVQSSSARDEKSSGAAVEQEKISELMAFADEMAAHPERFQAEDYMEKKESAVSKGVSYWYERSENISQSGVCQSARVLGEYLKGARVNYLGSVYKSENLLEEKKKSASDTAIDAFTNNSEGVVYISYCNEFATRDKEYSQLIYTIRGGVGYMKLLTNGLSWRTAEECYFNFPGTLPLQKDGSAALESFGTSSAEMNVSYADRQGFENAADDKNEVMTRDKSAGFVYSVDNSADVPVVNISSVVLPRGEAVVKASFEIHLCKTSADVSKMQTLAVMNVPAEVGSYDFSQYAQNIAKQDIDAVRIVLNISTDKHPAPNENTDAYMISGYSGVFGE